MIGQAGHHGSTIGYFRDKNRSKAKVGLACGRQIRFYDDRPCTTNQQAFPRNESAIFLLFILCAHDSEHLCARTYLQLQLIQLKVKAPHEANQAHCPQKRFDPAAEGRTNLEKRTQI
jgi:hypothetical protein